MTHQRKSTQTSTRRADQAQSSDGHGNTWDTDIVDGEFQRSPTEFRDLVTRDGTSGYRAEPGRYHLYVSYACPWAHRTLIVRALKGLEAAIDVSVVHPYLDSRGWHFDADYGDPKTVDRLYESPLLRNLYDRAAASGKYAGRITVPVLWDRKRETIVNNESAEIIRMFDSALDAVCEKPEVRLYPEPLRAEIDELNDWIYDSINNGVYRCGFARTQAAYEKAYERLFWGLDRVEGILRERRFLTGSQLTEADVRLFTTLVRFDPVYHNHFRCNRRKLRESETLWGYVLDVAQTPGVMGTIRMDHIKTHYYTSHESLNPRGIVPVGPDFDLHERHDRARLSQ